MHLLFTRFPLESRFGGAEVQTVSLMEGLIERGHNVQFLGSCQTLLKECRSRGIKATELHIGPPPVTKWGAISFFWRKRGMAQRLQHALGELLSFDAIFMLSLSEKLLLTNEAVSQGIKTIWIEHDRVGRWLTRNPWLPTLLTCSKNVTTVVVSPLSAKIYEEMGWEKEDIVTIPNGIDERKLQSNTKYEIRNTRYEKKSKDIPYNLKLGCIARLSKEKGIDLLIHAVKDLSDVSLTIVGTGRDELSLRQMITGPLKERITIVKHIEDIAAFILSLDFLVLPSREHDPFGMVAAEAMLLGKPVIVTDACGIAGYLRDGIDAKIVKADSQEELQKAISDLLQPEIRERIGGEGQKTAQSLFTLHPMIDRYLEVLS